jgi:hypothetical protein
MRSKARPIEFVRTENQKTALKSIFLRDAVFRRAITPDVVRAGLRPKQRNGEG